jgi:hypothetical protein
MFLALLVVFVPAALLGATVLLLVVTAVRRLQGAGVGPDDSPPGNSGAKPVAAS